MRPASLLFLLLAGCARTAADLLNAKKEGTVRVYSIPPDLAWEVAKGVLAKKGGCVMEDRGRRLIFTETSPAFFSSGTFLGAWIDPEGANASKVTFVTKEKSSFSVSMQATEIGFHSEFEELLKSGRISVPGAEAEPFGGTAGSNKPVILIASPEPGQKVTTPTLKVRGVCAGKLDPATLECFVNEEKVAPTRGIGGIRKSEGSGTETSFEFEVRLKEGSNHIRLSAGTKGETTAEKTVQVIYDPTATTPSVRKLPTIRSLVVGVSKYQDTSLTLKYARNDAELVSDFLVGPCVGIQREHLRTLYDQDATRENVIGALSELLKRSGKDDLVILYFAMHGVSDPEGGDDIYFLCHDSKLQNLEASALSRGSLEKLIRKSDTERILVIADACHAGMLGTSGIGKRDPAPAGYALLKKISEIEGKGVTFFSAADANEYSQERADLGHGVFTYHLIEGLKGKADQNGDGFVVLQEIEEYTYEKVKETTRGAQRPRMVRPISKDLPISKVP